MHKGKRVWFRVGIDANSDDELEAGDTEYVPNKEMETITVDILGL
jgi:hypothetical protein